MSSSLRIEATPSEVRISTPAFSAASMRVSMMVSELLVTGNILPSGSVLSCTPREVNQSMVSEALKRLKGPMRDFSPRG